MQKSCQLARRVKKVSERRRKVTDASHVFMNRSQHSLFTSFAAQCCQLLLLTALISTDLLGVVTFTSLGTMNPEGGGSVGQANENNQNEEGILEGFPQTEVNLLQQGENNNIGAGTDVPLHQVLNALPPDSNMSSSSFHVGSSSNTFNIPRKRSLGSSGQFYVGESSSMGPQETEEAKRVATESEVGDNNNVSPHNTETPIPPPNTGANRNENTNIGRRASDAPLSSQASLYFNGASPDPVQQPLHRLHSGRPISIQGGSFMPSGSSTVHNITVRTTPPTRCPHTRVDIMIPFFEHGSSSTWAPPQGPRGMNQSAAPTSSVTQNHLSPQQTPASAMPPNIFSPEMRRRLPPEVRSILDSLRNGGGLIFEIENLEPSTGLSLETIMQHMERVTFLDVVGDGPLEYEQRCTICLEEFDNESDLGKLELCDHKFHFDCIKQWLMQKNLCPVCRRVALERHLNNPNAQYGYFFLCSDPVYLSLRPSELNSATMNPRGGSTGEANARPHLSSETQERLLPLFPLFATEEGFPQPEVNLPQRGANNNGARTDVPLQETPNVVAPESNISSSSFLATTPPNPLENLDLCLNFSLSPTTISSAVIPISNVARSVHGSNSNSANIPRKRDLPDHASGEFHQGESSNMRQETGEIKRLATESEVRAHNNVNPSPPPLPLLQQEHQFLPGRHLNPNNARTPFAPPNGMTNTNQRRGSYGPIPSQGNFHFNGASTHSQLRPLQPSHSVRPLSFHSTSFMSSSASSVNNLTVWNATHSISSPCPHDRVDFMIPFYEHGNNMSGPVVTSVGNFPTYPPNRSYVDSERDTARRALSFGLPHQFEPSESEPLQLLPGSVRNGGRVSNARANTYHPLGDHASSSTWVAPLGSQGMPHYAAASSSSTQNHHSLMPVPQFPSLEVLRGLPSEFRSLLHSLRDGRGLMIEITPQASMGLSLETITQFMEREIFLVVDGNDPKENKEKCPVCLEEFCSGEDIGKLHSCVHKFHFDCIKQWLMQRNLCPVCRRTALEMHNNDQSSVVYIFE
ncbi:hypothetical protein VNO80_21509 [Phaseolus coccineus]|uniref:RING-type E3 ubiquitin transferase n=1 Tax=Phaseolus coccineus TaxID=3886 RepID=A0AAN9QR05_PHACN